MIRSIIPLVLLSGLTLSGAVLAAGPTTGTTQVNYHGLKVGIDAQTGKLRALTPAESRQLDMKMTGGHGLKLVNRQQARATQKPIVGGGVSMKLPADMMSAVTATRQADGTVTLSDEKTQELSK